MPTVAPPLGRERNLVPCRLTCAPSTSSLIFTVLPGIFAILLGSAHAFQTIRGAHAILLGSAHAIQTIRGVHAIFWEIFLRGTYVYGEDG
jgi:hypothetical protein